MHQRRFMSIPSQERIRPYYYDSDQYNNSTQEIVDLIRYRDLVWLMIINILRSRYRRSFFGIVWMLLNPLLNTLVLAIAFSSIFKSSLPNYPIYILSGLLIWNFVTQSSTHAMNTMLYGGGSLLKRIYIPRTIYAVTSVGNGLVNLLISLVVLFIIMLLWNHPFHENLWFVGVAIILATVFTLGLSLILSLSTVFFTDSIDIYGVVTQAFFFLTPIIYPLNMLPPQVQDLMLINPFYCFTEIFRTPIYSGVIPNLQIIIASLIYAIGFLTFGWILFIMNAQKIAYKI